MFQVLEVSLEMAKSVRPVVERIEERSAPLADQLRRAVESVALNFGESRWRRGKDRSNRFTYAAGSAEEARAALRLAVAWGYVSDAEVREADALLGRVLAMSWRLLNAGQRRSR